MADFLRLNPNARNALANSAQNLAQKALAKTAALAPQVDAKLKKIAQDFESVFLENNFDRMFSGLGEEGPLGAGDSAGGVWRSMLSGEYAKSMARSGGVGLSNDIYRELVKMQAANGAAGGAA